ncbi:MAG: hypothetical protein AABX29_01475, partial [Nanoarchaeota archaeon]
MITKDKLESILEGFNLEISTFSLDWILNNQRATQESVRQVYHILKGFGLKDDKIATQAQLLGRDP